MVSQVTYDFLFRPDLEKSSLIQNYYISWGIILAYVAFTKIIGPAIMKDRKPVDLKPVMILFNCLLVVSNMYLSALATYYCLLIWPYRCSKTLSLFRDFKGLQYLAWHAVLVKFLELFDTVFFILRKKFNQVSFLHVFHHSIVCILTVICFKQKYESYYVVLIAAINCGIHVLLYIYYGLSAFGPQMRKYLWWKKYLTILQIVQFFIIMTYMGLGFLTGCEKPGLFHRIVFVGVLFVTLLFFNFYFKTYTSEEKVKWSTVPLQRKYD